MSLEQNINAAVTALLMAGSISPALSSQPQCLFTAPAILSQIHYQTPAMDFIYKYYIVIYTTLGLFA